MSHQGMNRKACVERLHQRTTPWDVIVIGGGATGIGVAMDAASRGLAVLLLEQSDFGKGTSSRSTKLVHGGVRYLRQGNITLVRDALKERTLLRNNAPHLVHDMPFLIPCRSRWEKVFYSVGLKLYDLLAVGNTFGSSHGVSTDEATTRVPVLGRTGIHGGVIYHDGQFDDTRLLMNMAHTAHDHGGCLLNYMAVKDLIKSDDGRVTGVLAVDQETLETFHLEGRCVINAAGPFCDSVRRFDDADCESMIAPSQGVHVVLPRRLFPGDTAMIVPKTSDGRVLFIIPWHDHAIVGTTDTPIPEAVLEPSAQADEIRFLLDTAAEYLEERPKISDVLSVFIGIRPLVKGDKSARTASLSRDHVIRVSPSGLMTITGGKWTTVRKMAEDCVDRAIQEAGLPASKCLTETMRLHGASDREDAASKDPRAYYGTDLRAIQEIESASPELGEPLCESQPNRKSEVIWAVRNEMARSVEDVLARRTRILFLDVRAALEVAPEVARLMAAEMRHDEAWCDGQIQSFQTVAQHYIPLLDS